MSKETIALYYLNPNNISIVFEDGDIAVWKIDDPNFNNIVTLAEKGLFNPIKTLHNMTKAIMTNNEVKVVNDGIVEIGSGEEKVVLVPDDNNPILGLIKILQEKGIIESEITRIKPFLKNCIENTFINAPLEIFEWCKAKDFEITEDGCFLAYKRVRHDNRSIHPSEDGTHLLHEIGKYTVENDFDTDRDNECSKGLHFCSKKYLDSYDGDKIIIVKINPKDVVAIPRDYCYSKGRCREYMMVGDMAADGTLQTTNIEKATGEKIVKEKIGKKLDKEVAKFKNRISETAQWMVDCRKKNKKATDAQIIDMVAAIMNISVETVKRNMRKFKSRQVN